MYNPMIQFFESFNDMILESPTENDIQSIKELSSNRLPITFIDAYSKSVPADDMEYDDFVFYGLRRMIEENTDYVPGANLLPIGFFTFASTFDGDSICFDMTDGRFSVYQCSHSLHSGEDDISYFKGTQIYSLPFNYENVIQTAPMLADSFDSFVSNLISGDVKTFSVTEMIERLP